MSKLANNRALDSQTETRVVAMIARGDSYSTIVDQLKKDGIDISISTVGVIKKRNPDALDHMKQIIINDQTTRAEKILDKSRVLIDKRLTEAMKVEEELAELHEDYHNGTIDDEEYRHKFDYIIRQQVSLPELNQVAKEAFNQSQVEAGKPTSITENPAQAKENLKTLLQAINNNDTKGMMEAIFLDA